MKIKILYDGLSFNWREIDKSYIQESLHLYVRVTYDIICFLGDTCPPTEKITRYNAT